MPTEAAAAAAFQVLLAKRVGSGAKVLDDVPSRLPACGVPEDPFLHSQRRNPLFGNAGETKAAAAPPCDSHEDSLTFASAMDGDGEAGVSDGGCSTPTRILRLDGRHYVEEAAGPYNPSSRSCSIDLHAVHTQQPCSEDEYNEELYRAHSGSFVRTRRSPESPADRAWSSPGSTFEQRSVSPSDPESLFGGMWPSDLEKLLEASASAAARAAGGIDNKPSSKTNESSSSISFRDHCCTDDSSPVTPGLLPGWLLETEVRLQRQQSALDMKEVDLLATRSALLPFRPALHFLCQGGSPRSTSKH